VGYRFHPVALALGDAALLLALHPKPAGRRRRRLRAAVARTPDDPRPASRLPYSEDLGAPVGRQALMGPGKSAFGLLRDFPDKAAHFARHRQPEVLRDAADPVDDQTTVQGHDAVGADPTRQRQSPIDQIRRQQRAGIWPAITRRDRAADEVVLRIGSGQREDRTPL
jgi:hypothetical protein